MCDCHQNTASHLSVKGIDYFTEEYVKQVLQNSSAKKLNNLLPFIGSISYPGDEFPAYRDYVISQQFQDTIFVGFLEMLFPDLVLDGNPAFTAISFNLDGIVRHFVVVAGGTESFGEVGTFQDYVNYMFPDNNVEIPFSMNIHVIKDIVISSESYEVFEMTWAKINLPSAQPQTVDFKFGFTCSGYKALMQ